MRHGPTHALAEVGDQLFTAGGALGTRAGPRAARCYAMPKVLIFSG